MNEIYKRNILFLIGCIGFRLTLVYLAFFLSVEPHIKHHLPALGYVFLIPALGFIIIYSLGLRESGAEVLGDKIWWNFLRPVHSILLLLFSYLAINRDPRAWKILMTDTSLGLLAFAANRYGLL